MAIITTSEFNGDLVPGLVRNWFDTAGKDMPTYYDKVFKVEQSTKAWEVDALMSGFSTLQQKDEGSALTLDLAKQGIMPQYRNITYALGFAITMEMMEDGDAMKNAMKFAQKLKMSGMQTRENICAQVLNRAFTASGLGLMNGGDGVALVSASHPTRSGTQSNLVTGGSVDVSEAGIEQVLIDIRNALDDRGLRANLTAQKIVCSTTDEPQVNRILYSSNRVATTDNDLNYIRYTGKLPGGIIANPYLTDADAWFIITDASDGLKYYNRKDLTMDNSNDFDTKNGRYSCIMRCSAGWSDFRGVYGSAGV